MCVAYSAREASQQRNDTLISHHCQVLLVATGNRCYGSTRTGQHVEVVTLEQVDK